MAEKFYLVTGGSGFIGSALVKALVYAGHRVRVLDNNSRGTTRHLAEIEGNYEFVEGDIRDLEIVTKAVTGIDAVCHLAFVNGTEFFYKMPELVLDIGIKGMTNILDACIKENVPELILASSSEVYQAPPLIPTPEDVPLSVPDIFNPRYSYATAKIVSEVMAVNYGKKYFEKTMIFRPHNVYGPDMGWEHVIPQFALRMQDLDLQTEGTIQYPLQGTGKETRAFIFISDFIDGLMQMLQFGQNQQVYHIGSEQEVTIEHIAHLIAKCFNRKIEIVSGPLAAGGTLRRCPDISKLKQLGFWPKIDLETGVQNTVEWYKQNRHLQKVKVAN
jgi:nucleoside-diphosphate-sugar epimerase